MKTDILFHKEEFLLNLKSLNLSKETIRLREGCLNHFISFLAEQNISSILKINRKTIEAYQLFVLNLKRKDRNGETIDLSLSRKHVYLNSLQIFFRYLKKKNYLIHNFADDIILPALPKRLPRNILTLKEIEKILRMPDINNKFGIRDRAIIETFYSTGIRSSELCNLKITDIDYDRGWLNIYQGKGRKDRVVPIGETALRWISRYLDFSRPSFLGQNACEILFLKQGALKFDCIHLASRVRGYIRKANINKDGACHLFRHTMATHMLENDCDIRYIGEILGHVDVTTTEVYTKVNIKKLQEVYKHSMPLI